MAEPSKTLHLRKAAADRLRLVLVANGYHTDAGADVRTETSQSQCTAPFLTVYSSSNVRVDGERGTRERLYTLTVEGQLPIALANASEQMDLMADDVEAALDEFQPPAGANALRFQFLETVYLDKPDGLPVMAFQSMFSVGFRR